MQVWGCGGLYKLGCYGFLALVNKEGKASGVCAGGACLDIVYMDKACIGKVAC